MWNIFWFTVKEKKWTATSCFLAGFIFLWLFVAFSPTVQQSSRELSQMVKSMPEGLIKAFGLDPKFTITLEGFIASKHFSLMWPIILIALTVSLGSSLIAGEIEKKTIGILLSQPVSRFKIFWGKFLAALFYLIIFIPITVISAIPLAKIYHIVYVGENYFTLALVGLLMGLSILGLVMLFSSLFSEKGKVNFLVIGLLIVMYFLNIIALIKENLDKVKYFSFFYYFNYTELLVHNKINNQSLIFFGFVFIITICLAVIYFKKRDITI